MWLLVGLAALVPLSAIVVVVVLVSNGRINLPGGAVLGDLNPKANLAGYDTIRNGTTLSEVEGVLGGGRPANSADLEAICGTEVERYTNPYYRERAMWENNSRNGLVRVWANGNVRILGVFSQQGPNGILLRKVIKDADGSVLSTGSMGYGPPGAVGGPPPPIVPNVPVVPGKQAWDGKAINPVAPTWEQMAGTWESVNPPGMRYQIGPQMEIGVGSAEHMDMNPILRSTTKNGLYTPYFAFGQRQFALHGSFWFENGTLYNGHQDDMVQTRYALKRIK